VSKKVGPGKEARERGYLWSLEGVLSLLPVPQPECQCLVRPGSAQATARVRGWNGAGLPRTDRKLVPRWRAGASGMQRSRRCARRWRQLPCWRGCAQMTRASDRTQTICLCSCTSSTEGAAWRGGRASSRRLRACSWKVRHATPGHNVHARMPVHPLIRACLCTRVHPSAAGARYLLLFRYGRLEPESGGANNVRFSDVEARLAPEVMPSSKGPRPSIMDVLC